MAELTKKDLKGAMLEAIEPFAKSIQQDLHLVKLDLSEVKKEVREMKENTSELFSKLDKFISLYEKQEQETVILGEQLKRLEDRVARLETRSKIK